MGARPFPIDPNIGVLSVPANATNVAIGGTSTLDANDIVMLANASGTLLPGTHPWHTLVATGATDVSVCDRPLLAFNSSVGYSSEYPVTMQGAVANMGTVVLSYTNQTSSPILIGGTNNLAFVNVFAQVFRGQT